MTDATEAKMIEYVSNCEDADKLRNIAKNAKSAGKDALAEAAKRKLFSVMPSEAPGTLEYEVWQSIFALEDALKDERGKTVLLSRTRQKIKAQDEQRCVADLVCGKPSDGFEMLMDRDMLDLSFEAVALRFPERFTKEVLAAARMRLEGVGYPLS